MRNKGFTRNVAAFGVDNISSSHTDNNKNKILLTVLIQQKKKKKKSINFSKAKTKFCLSMHYSGFNSYLHVNRKEIYKIKIHDTSV